MRHIFIVNPAAGRRDSTDALSAGIRRIMDGQDYEIHRTGYPGHARELTGTLAAQYAPETCRFYACGGDGTLCEVAGGAVGHANAEVACVPCGTGNDFIRVFENREFFRDLRAQLSGSVLALDVMEVNGRYALNICNSGLDARVAHWVHNNKRKLPFSGIFPYAFSLILHFFKCINRFYTLEIDGERQEGEYAIIVAANGRSYGGGFNAVPEADPDDGKMDLLFIPRISRLTFLRCICKYATGRHAELPHLIHHLHAREIRLLTPEPEPLSADGEISLETEVCIRLIRGGLHFVQPLGCSIRHHAAPAADPTPTA